MTIQITLAEILHRCNDWNEVCEKKGWSPWAVKEGGGDIVETLTEQEAIDFGILRGDDLNREIY